MTDEEKMKRALEVENLYRLYKKYYPSWVEQKKKQFAKLEFVKLKIRIELNFKLCR